MATRYVWQKYATTIVTETSTNTYSNINSAYVPYKGMKLAAVDSPWSWTYSGSRYYLSRTIYISSQLTGIPYTASNGMFTLPSAGTPKECKATTSQGSYGTIPVTASYHNDVGEYLIFTTTSTNTGTALYSISIQSTAGSFEMASVGICADTANLSNTYLAVWFITPRNLTITLNCERKSYSKTGSASNASNSSSSAYPTDGISGSNWYTYQGSDSIDATAVGYSTQAPMGGQPITINVTPATPTYGGTIQYTYQVQLSGGSWTTIATKTTATSQQYTIPAGTTSFAARVVANDTWGFSSSTYTTGSTITVTNNQPPTAPGSISIGSVVGGQQCTITWTAATDPDGTIASYQLERQVDNGNTWSQIYSGSAMTYTDTINADWATVNYRVKATDNDGDSGPYATGTMQTVNSGWLYFSGPPADMGSQPAPFDFVFSIGSTGASPATNISVAVIYDDETIYTGTVDADEEITINIDTRLTYAGTHDIIVTASADSFLAVTQQCDFTVPSVTLPDGGAAGFMEDDAGGTYYPTTLARYVIGLKGLDANALFDRVYTGTYTGTGTSGSGNPCSVRTSFEPILVFIQAAAASTATSGYWVNSAPGQSSQGNMIVNNNGTVTLCPVTWDAEAMTLSWYGTSAAAQLNASGTVYGIIALGGMA